MTVKERADQAAEKAANDLAKKLRDEPWYHRTTMVWQKGVGCFVTVWGEGNRPENLPETYQGWPVAFNRVSKRNPCPFGSVKKEYVDA